MYVSPYLLMYNQAPLDKDAADNRSAWKSVGSLSLLQTGDKISGTACGREKQMDPMETKRDSDYYQMESN